MKLKTIAAAVLMAAVAVALVPAASAAKRDHGIISSRGCVPGYREMCTYPQPFRHRHRHSIYIYFYGGYWHPWPYYQNPYYDDDFGVANPMTCNYAKGLLQRRGYSSLKASDCTGTYYRFTGYKHGHKYKLTLNSYSGRYSRRLVY